MATRETFQEAIRLYVETAGDREVAALAAQLSKLGDGSDRAAEHAQKLMAELEKFAGVSNNIRRFTELKGSITETGTALQKAKEKLAGLGSEIDRTAEPSTKLQKALQRAAKEVENLSRQQNRQTAELARTEGALRDAGVDVTQLGKAYTDLRGKMDGFAQRAGAAAAAAERTGRDTRKAASGLSEIDKAASKSSASLGAIASRLTLVSGAATAALSALASFSGAALFTGAINSAATLEDVLTQVRAVSGATAEEMVALQSAAEQGGAATRFSTLEAARALGELARATGTAESAIAALPATLNLAQAAGMDVATAANIITTTLSQFGLGFENAARVADLFATEANSTQDTVEKLGNAMSYAAPLAASLGISLEETTAILGALATSGFQGERAGTALRNVFSEMLDPASAFAKALRDLGIETNDFGEVMRQLAEKGDRGRDAILQLDAAARPAILRLVQDGGAKLGELEAALGRSAGAAERTARQMGESFGGATEAITDSLDRTRRSLVEPLLAPLGDELQKLAADLEEFAKSPEFEQIKVALTELFVEGAQAARELVENIDFAEVAENIRVFLTDADGSLSAFRENLGTVVDAVVIIGDTVEVVFNAVQSVILGLAAAVTKAVSLIAEQMDFLTQGGVLGKVLQFMGVIEEGKTRLGEFAAGMNAVSEEFAGRMVDNVGQTIDAVAEFGEGVGTASRLAADGLSQAADASGKAAEAAKQTADAVMGAADALTAQAEAAAAAGSHTQDAADRMAAGAERLKQAFSDLGIESQSNLEQSAAAAKRSFDIIREAVANGQASAEDARRAFTAYAQAARAAVADADSAKRARVEGELRVQESILAVTRSLDEMGAAGARANGAITDGAQGAVIALDRVGDAAERAATGTQRAADAAAESGDRFDMASKQGEGFALAMFNVSEKAQRMYADLNRAQSAIAGSGARFARGINEITGRINEQGEALQRQIAQLQAAAEADDEWAQRRRALSQQFDLLGADNIERLVQAEQRAEAVQRRRLEAQRRAQQEARNVGADAEGTVQIARAAQEDGAIAAEAAQAVLDSTRHAAVALNQAAGAVLNAGEFTIRIVQEVPPGALAFRLSDQQLDYLVRAVINRLQAARRSST